MTRRTVLLLAGSLLLACGSSNAERETWIKANLQRIATESFPDDTGVTWKLLGVEHMGDVSSAEAEPRPQTVGYPKFRFEFSFRKLDAPELTACYCWKEGKWSRLFE